MTTELEIDNESSLRLTTVGDARDQRVEFRIQRSMQMDRSDPAKFYISLYTLHKDGEGSQFADAWLDEEATLAFVTGVLEVYQRLADLS